MEITRNCDAFDDGFGPCVLFEAIGPVGDAGPEAAAGAGVAESPHAASAPTMTAGRTRATVARRGQDEICMITKSLHDGIREAPYGL
ncbi:hypothetical protein [Streptosporangium sp. NPDC002721]|uniref:hypothetical protein n=1 Tax=Streptosporangium sp. NPDC002721 TaxID=3366188 RepID=UPI0036B64CF7